MLHPPKPRTSPPHLTQARCNIDPVQWDFGVWVAVTILGPPGPLIHAIDASSSRAYALGAGGPAEGLADECDELRRLASERRRTAWSPERVGLAGCEIAAAAG